MDLLRKMSSGLRSSQELSAAVAQSKKEDESSVPAPKTPEEQDDDGTGDEYEDAAVAPGGQEKQQPEKQQQKTPATGGAEQRKEDESEGKGQDTPAAGVSTAIRAPPQVSDEYDAYDDDDDDVAEEEDEEDEEEEDDDEEGEEEYDEDDGGEDASRESYDSALERMAGSSDATYDTASSPRITSPVGSLSTPVVIGDPPTTLNPSQQGALMRLNEMLTGESSLDTSVIDHSTEDAFKSTVANLAEQKGGSVEDPKFGSILDALMPLITDREVSGGERPKIEGEGKDDDDEKSKASQSPMPRAELTAEDGSDGDEDKVRGAESDEEEDEESKPTPAVGDGGENASPKVKAPASELDSDTEVEAPAPAPPTPTAGGAERGVLDGRDDSQDDRPVAKPSQEEKGGGRYGDDEEEEKEKSVSPEMLIGQGQDEDVYEEEEEEGEEGEGDEEEEDEEDEEDDDDDDVRRSAELAALVQAVDSSAGGGAGGAGESAAPSLGSAGPSLPARPTPRAPRPSLPSLDPAPRAPRAAGGAGAVAAPPIDSNIQQVNGDTAAAAADADGNEETREKLQAIRVKFLRLALRLGQPTHNVVVAQVLYRLGLAEQLRGGRSSNRSSSFSFDRANAIAEDQEASGGGTEEELDFSCTIMMLGKTGVGKSATINSIFDERKTGTNAHSPSTKKVQVITGHVHGIKVRVIDTPGLLPSVQDQRHNEKIMASVKGFIKKQSPDIVLYFDRLDMQSRDFGDLPLLRTITDTFGAAVWFNAIVVLTHASSAPPDGPNGLPLSYEMFVAQRSHVVQQTIRQAAGDMRLMNPVSLVENHVACRMNRARERVLPNGQVWKPQLLLLCFASKILAEANSLLKLQDNTPGRPFGGRSRVPPLPFLLSSLLQSRAQLKLPEEQMGDEDESDEDLEEDSDSDDEDDYDQLPPFRRLSKEEVAELDEENRGNYFEELAERERLFQKKQWREELRRRREMKRRMAEAIPQDLSQFVDEGMEEELARSAAVPVPMPDMVLPPSFDSDNPSHRYRYLETANQWLVRPVLETHGWDHDNGYDGMSVEKMFVVGQNIPASVSGQITKDKKEANLNMEAAASLKHGEGRVTLAGLDLQTVGKDVGYTIRSETRFSNFKGNKTTGGLAVTLLGDTISAGMKLEDRLMVGKRMKLVLNGGAITGGGDVAYGGSLEATLRDKEYPLSRTLSTLGVSIMDWHGDLAIGGNLQSQFIVGKTMMVGRANLNNRGAGQISIRASSSDQMQMTLIGLLPIIRSLVNRLFFGSQQQGYEG